MRRLIRSFFWYIHFNEFFFWFQLVIEFINHISADLDWTTLVISNNEHIQLKRVLNSAETFNFNSNYTHEAATQTCKKNMCDANFIIFQTRKDQKNENNVNYTWTISIQIGFLSLITADYYWFNSNKQFVLIVEKNACGAKNTAVWTCAESTNWYWKCKKPLD